MAFDNEKMNQMFLRLYLGVEAFKNICNEYQCQSCPIPHQLCGNMATPDLDNVKSAWGAVCNKSDDEIDALLHQATEDAPVIEQNDAENDAARLDPAGPFEEAAGDDQQDNADKGTEVHQGVHSAFRMEDDVDAEHSHTDEAADDGSKQSVSAGEPGVTHIVPHTEDRTDAGKGGIAVEGGVQQRTKSGCNGGLDVSHPDFVEGMLR